MESESVKAQFDAQSHHLSYRIHGLETVLMHWAGTATDAGVTPLPISLDDTLLRLDDISARLGDDLITIAMVGPFSSGKSLLLSALLDQIDAIIDDRYGTWDWQSRLLPSDPRPTTSHPLEVRRGDVLRLWLQYAGVSEPTEVEASKASIARFVTRLGEAPFDSEHDIVGAILETPDVPLPGRLLDLPGTQSTNAGEDEVIDAGLNRADCVIFVVSATRTIDAQGQMQLEDLYKYFLTDGKPVFFVLTQVDGAMNRAFDGEAAWEVSLRDNNSTIENIGRDPRTGQPDEEFVGRGFVPVATPSVAKAKYLAAKGLSDRVVDAELMIGSPARLVIQLTDFFYRQVAPRRLRRIEREIDLLKQVASRDLWSTIATLQAPVEQLEERERSIQADLARIAREQAAAAAEVHAIFSTLIETAFGPRVRSSLRQELALQVEPVIHSARRVDGDFASHVALLTAKTCIVWIKTSADSPFTRWRRHEISKLRESAAVLSRLMQHNIEWGEVDSILSALDLDNPVSRKSIRIGDQVNAGDVGTVSHVVGVMGGAAGVGTAVALSGALLLLPVGLAAGGLAASFAVRANQRRRAKLQASKSALLDYLDDECDAQLEVVRIAFESRAEVLSNAIEAALSSFVAAKGNELRLVGQQLDGERTRAADVDVLVDLTEQFQGF